MTRLVIDASVVVAAVSPSEARHAEALEFLQHAHQRNIAIEEPAYFLLELYAVLNRRPRELRELGFMTEDKPMSMHLRSIGEPEVQRMLDWLTSKCRGKSPTRGADLAYLLVALDAGVPLVTLDTGLRSFREFGADVYFPGEISSLWCAAQ